MTKMNINIRPLVIQKNDETFKIEWQTDVKQNETKLMDTVQTHSTRTIDKTNSHPQEHQWHLQEVESTNWQNDSQE